jgi:hypothetical protein
VIAAVLGAWAGDAIMGRLGLDILTVGDYHLLGASLLAWAGIGLATRCAQCHWPRARHPSVRTRAPGNR